MKTYYFFYLEIALKGDDPNIYAYENVSHIPTKKLIEVFNIDLNEDPHLLEGYFLTESNYEKYREFIKEHIGQINLEVFEYTLRQYVADDFKGVRKLYKEDLME